MCTHFMKYLDWPAWVGRRLCALVTRWMGDSWCEFAGSQNAPKTGSRGPQKPGTFRNSPGHVRPRSLGVGPAAAPPRCVRTRVSPARVLCDGQSQPRRPRTPYLGYRTGSQKRASVSSGRTHKTDGTTADPPQRTVRIRMRDRRLSEGLFDGREVSQSELREPGRPVVLWEGRPGSRSQGPAARSSRGPREFHCSKLQARVG